MRRHLLSLVLLASATSIFNCARAQKRPITDRDLFAFHWIGDTQLSPSGSTVCFVETTVTPDHSGYQTALYLLDLTAPNAAPQLLTPGPHDSAPRWSPDGKQIAFIRSIEKPGTPRHAAAALPHLRHAQRQRDQADRFAQRRILTPMDAQRRRAHGSILHPARPRENQARSHPQSPRHRRRCPCLRRPHHQPNHLPLQRGRLPRPHPGPAALHGLSTQSRRNPGPTLAAHRRPLRRGRISLEQIRLALLHLLSNRRIHLRRVPP